jgi:heterotetrameric sarcosine oxidase gamma subunit
VARLIARSPAAGLTPVTAGETTLDEVVADAITSVAAYPGSRDEASQALAAATGLALPAPNRTEAAGERRVVWSGHDQALVVGPAPGAVAGAAVTNQSDGWTILRIAGPAAVDTLARLVPLDLRATAFPEGSAARSLLNHMPLVIWRDGADSLVVMTFRSMAATAVHELTEALQSVASRG